MNQNQCQMIDSPESIKCNKHNKNIEFVLIHDHIKGKEKLLCKLCFEQTPGQKLVYSISEAINIIYKRKNTEYGEQKIIIQDQLHKIINHLDDMQKLQGNFLKLIGGVLEALGNMKLELEQKINDISKFNFLEEIDKLNSQNQTTINNQQINEYIEKQRLSYSEKIQNNIQSLQDIAIESQELCKLQEFIPKNYDSEQLLRANLRSYINQGLQSNRDNIDDENKISVKLNQTAFQLDRVLALAFNYDDSLLAYSNNKEIKLWKFQLGIIGNCIDTLNQHTQIIFTIIFSKRKNWLFSAGKDMSIILWKPKLYLFNFIITTKQQYLNAHQDSILQLILNQNENQLISCSSDCKISIWTVNYKQNSIQYQYSLERHTGPVISVCLNQSNNLLVSSGLDKQIIIWSQNMNQEWIFKQVIDKKTNDFGYRISFISDLYIVWQSFKKGLTHIFKEENDIFHELSEKRIQLTNNDEIDGDYSFPSIFNSNKQILIQKYHKRIFFFILNQQNELKVQQEQIIFNDEESYGNLSNNGKYLAIWCNQKVNIYEIHYS